MTVVFHGGRGYSLAFSLVNDKVGIRHAGNIAIGRTRLPSDPIGVFTLTLTNLVIGSSVQIEIQGTTTTVHNAVVTSSVIIVSLQTYQSGNPNNNLRIKVRKGSSSPYYQPYETQTTAVVGSQSIYVSQIPDE